MTISTKNPPTSFSLRRLFLHLSANPNLPFSTNDAFLISNSTIIFLLLLSPSLLFLYCGTDCRSFIRSLSQLKGHAGGVRKQTHTHTLKDMGCRARWVTAASRPRVKSLWRDARLSYALNRHSDRLQDTKRKSEAVERAGALSFI